MNTLILIILLLLLFIICFFILKNIILSIFISWWMFWLIIASLSISGLYELNFYTYFIFVSFLIFTVAGSIFEKLLFNGAKNIPCTTKLLRHYSLLNKLLALILIFTIIYIGISLFLFKDNFNPITYRAIVFTEDSPLYSNKYIGVLFSMILRPLYFACLFVGVACIIIYRDYKIFITGLSFLIIIAVAEFGRFELYLILIMLLYLSIMGVKFNRIYLYSSLGLILSMMIYISSLRSTVDENLIELLFHHYVINYHTFSFSIFNIDLINPTSRLHDITLGFSSIFSIFDPIVILLRLSGFDIVPESGIMAKSLDEYRDIGLNSDGFSITANAFGSILYGLYRDGGLLFVLFFGFVYGFFLQMLNHNTESNVFRAGSMAAMFYLGMFGIFMPLVQFPWLISFLYIKLFDRFFTKKLL